MVVPSLAGRAARWHRKRNLVLSVTGNWKSSRSRRSIFDIAIFVHAKRDNTAAVPLTVAEQGLGSSIEARYSLPNDALAINSKR
jgi:hypothetical protein